MRKLVIAVTLTASILVLAACNSDKADSDSDSKVVVNTKVGDITNDDFYNELKKNHGAEVLQSMVIVKVLEDKYKVTDKDVDERIEQFKNEQGEQFDMWLMQIGVTDVKDEGFRSQVRNLVLQEKVQYEGIEVTDEEIKDKYDEMKENRQIEINASHILVDDEKTAKEVKKKLDEGGDFAELAKEYSKDGSAENGGELGYFSSVNNKMVPEFEDGAYALKVGEISEPVKSEHGYHIITVTDIPTLEDKKEEIRQVVLQSKVVPAELQEKIDTMLKDAKIDIKIDEFKDLFKFEDNEEKPKG